MTDPTAVQTPADAANKEPAPPRPWWLALVVLTATYALLVGVSLLAPAALLPIGTLAVITTTLILYGPEMLSKLGPDRWLR